ncbi:BTAD domain-containing putative transcriptional regulator [Motilibacter deserti]|uniref:AAA family ATPase n=1 Tax=Motilibacter deserti TaxID=2714956 RepID=A0ABX0GR88_9ACTN|nr:BTAD domain-containing putative transcriptional regulator [Motilibacter deserti]NHC12985.1 AAA family ATPase [Motilibacter deserti]
MVTFRVLGPLEAYDGGRPLDLKGPRHRAVLARLLVARRRVVPVRRLIDDLWEDPPEAALGAVQTFVGALRKALEPTRPPRTPSHLLVTAAPGYALRPAADAVDAWRFEDEVARSGALLDGGQAAEAHAVLDAALGSWSGGAYAEFADLPWARAEAARLDELRLLAVERRAAAALALGREAAAVPGLEAHAAAHPLREEAWRLLALALYRSGRQADALAAVRRAHDVLRAEVGADLGPALQQLQADILAQSPRLALVAPPPGAARPPAVELLQAPAPAAPGGLNGPDNAVFVGRADELAQLERAAAAVLAYGRPHVALVSGVAGAGKTALARAAAGRLAAAGWAVAWGECPELAGAPAAWPWAQALREAGVDWPEDAVPLPTRFARARAAVGLVARATADRPLLVVLDDLQWADDDALALLVALSAAPAAGRLLVLGTYRSTELSPTLTEALGRLARHEPTRVYLGGLGLEQVAQLATAVGARPLSPEALRQMHVRSGGNPFFVRELLAVWDAEGEGALQSVPPGVRDVLRHRLAGLPAAARTHLRQAAVLGVDPDLDVLAALAGDEELVLESVEAALLAGFLVESDAERLRFAHALVQETLYDELPQARRAQWHAAAGAYLVRERPDEVEAVAFHLVRAGSRAAPEDVAHYAAAAARSAERRTAVHEAARLWGEALAALDRWGSGGPRRQLEALMGRVRALAVTGRLAEARRHRAAALDAVESLDDPVLVAAVLGSFDVPAVWPVNDDDELSARIVDVAERALVRLPAGSDAERVRLLVTVAMERRADETPRGRAAADEAEQLARRLDDPLLLALALNARFLQAYARAGLAPERAAIGAQLLQVAGEDDGLAPFAVLGHLVLLQSACALGDLDAADEHAAAVDRIAERYDLPAAGTFTAWYAALRLAVTGERAPAEAAYRRAAARLTGAGMAGVEHGILGLALATLHGGDGEPEECGPYAEWVRPVALLARGDRQAARAALDEVPTSPRDLLFEARSCLHLLAAVKLGELAAVERSYAALLPAADELAGAGSGLVTLGPVAEFLGRSAAALGRRDDAAAHFRQAVEVARRAGSARWEAAAAQALAQLEAD